MALARLALNMGKVFSIVFLWIILLWSLKQFLPDPKRFRLPQKDEKRWKLKTDHDTIGWSQRQGQRQRPLIMITSMIKGFGWVACRAEEKEGNLGSWLRKTKVIIIIDTSPSTSSTSLKMKRKDLTNVWDKCLIRWRDLQKPSICQWQRALPEMLAHLQISSSTSSSSSLWLSSSSGSIRLWTRTTSTTLINTDCLLVSMQRWPSLMISCQHMLSNHVNTVKRVKSFNNVNSANNVKSVNMFNS